MITIAIMSDLLYFYRKLIAREIYFIQFLESCKVCDALSALFGFLPPHSFPSQHYFWPLLV